MTSKNLQNSLTEIVNVFIKAKGLDGRTGVQGGKREVAQAFIGMALIDHADSILRQAGLTDEQIKQARQELAAEAKTIKVAQPPADAPADEPAPAKAPKAAPATA